jgi:hypothetical protein
LPHKKGNRPTNGQVEPAEPLPSLTVQKELEKIPSHIIGRARMAYIDRWVTKVLKLRDEGKSLSEIKELSGMDTNTVWRIVNYKDRFARFKPDEKFLEEPAKEQPKPDEREIREKNELFNRM